MQLFAATRPSDMGKVIIIRSRDQSPWWRRRSYGSTGLLPARRTHRARGAVLFNRASALLLPLPASPPGTPAATIELESPADTAPSPSPAPHVPVPPIPAEPTPTPAPVSSAPAEPAAPSVGSPASPPGARAAPIELDSPTAAAPSASPAPPAPKPLAPAEPTPAPAAEPSAPDDPAPAFPERMNKRPRRARRTGAGLLHAPETLPVQRHALQLNGKMIPPSALPLVPPASEPGRKAEAKLKPLRGLEYGPKFTCPVDTLLTVLAFVLSKKERKAMRKGEGQELAAGGAGPPADAAVEFAAATSRQAWRELALATRGLRKTGDSRAAKRKWYECMVTQQAAQKRRKAAGDPGSKHGRRASHTARNGAAASSGSCGAIECRCACRCLLCSTGRCQFCASCGCDTQRLLGHCFGLAEQLFHHLAPDGITSSLLHFCSHTAWACTRCAYGFATANGCQPHLPLLLSVEDVDALLASGVAPEVGALVSAHLGAAPYDYGACPSCGEGLLRSRPLAPRFPPLLLVEIGRPGVIGGGAHTDRFPWRLDLAPEMGLGLDGKAAAYRAVAVVYNDGDHWWADLLSDAHFKKRRAPGSYRYDGLEAGGALRYAGRGPAIARTSEPRHMSLVWYRNQTATEP